MESRQNEKTVLQYLLEYQYPGLATDLIVPVMDIASFAHLARTCRRANSIFKPYLTISKAAHYVVVKPSLIELKKILDTLDPNALKIFLQQKVKNIIDQSGRTILNNTLLQLAFGAGDDEMCLVFKDYFKLAFGSDAEKIIINQLDEKFHQMNEAYDLQIKQQLAVSLNTVIKAILNECFVSGKDEKGRYRLSITTLHEIAAFRKTFYELHQTIINKGMHYRTQSLVEVYECFATESKKWFDEQKVLFMDAVFSTILSYSPANDAMKFSQGLYYLLRDKPEPFKRSFIIRETKQHFYSYLASDSTQFCISGNCFDLFYASPTLSTWALESIKKMFAEKNAALNSIRTRPYSDIIYNARKNK